MFGAQWDMAPEQACGESEKISQKSDQYSLGLILQELVTFMRIPPGLPEDVFRRAEGANCARYSFSPKIPSGRSSSPS